MIRRHEDENKHEKNNLPALSSWNVRMRRDGQIQTLEETCGSVTGYLEEDLLTK